jgi:hypothetical protein
MNRNEFIKTLALTAGVLLLPNVATSEPEVELSEYELIKNAHWALMSQTGLSIRSGTLESVSSFASIEGRNTFLQSLEPEMCTWQDGSIHEKPRAQSFINYLKSWSQEEIDGWTKRMCPPYDYIIMRYANQYRHDIVVEYHTCTVPKFIYPLQ